MKSSTSIVINAPARAIYDLASDTQRWPGWLPHYRFVRVLSERDGERTIEMAARRGIIPVRWIAVQRNDAATPAISFHHLWGWTKDMDATWSFEESNGSTRVTILHEARFGFPLAIPLVERFVESYFIEGIARRTLACTKRVLEEPRDA